jgi:hypothetical protein
LPINQWKGYDIFHFAQLAQPAKLRDILGKLPAADWGP